MLHIKQAVEHYQTKFLFANIQTISCPILGANSRRAYDISLKLLDLKKLDINNHEHMRTMELSYRYLSETVGENTFDGVKKTSLNQESLSIADIQILKKIQSYAKNVYGIQGYFYENKKAWNRSLQAFGDMLPTGTLQALLDLGCERNDKRFSQKFDALLIEKISTESNGNTKVFIQKLSDELLKDGINPEQHGLYITHLMRAYGYDLDANLQKTANRIHEEFADFSTKVGDEFQQLHSFIEEVKQEKADQNKIQAQMKTHQHFQETLRHGTAFISSLAHMLGDHELAQAANMFGHVALQFSKGILDIVQAGGFLAAGISPYFMIGSAIFTFIGFLKSGDAENQSNVIIFQQMQSIAKFLDAFRHEMHGRFDRLENIMEYQYGHLMINMFEKFAEMSSDIHHVRQMNDEIFKTLESFYKDTQKKLNELLEADVEFSRNELADYDGNLKDFHTKYFHEAKHWALKQATKSSALGTEPMTVINQIKLLQTPEHALGYITSLAKEIDSSFKGSYLNLLVNPSIFIEGVTIYMGWRLKAGRPIADANEDTIYDAMMAHGNATKLFLQKLGQAKKIPEFLTNQVRQDLGVFIKAVEDIEKAYIEKEIIAPFKKTIKAKIKMSSTLTETDPVMLNKTDPRFAQSFIVSGVINNQI